MPKSCTEFWRGDFGDEYTKRNVDLVKNNIRFFDDIFWKCLAHGGHQVSWESMIEFGAGAGNNIKALIESDQRSKHKKYTAVEINESACEQLREIEKDFHFGIINRDINDGKGFGKHDLVLTKGLLIHIPPEKLKNAYQTIYDSSNKYILICEYYNPTPVMIRYRGEDDKLWKRDFAGDLLSLFPDLELIDYGFTYHKDEFPQDDITWFLMEKK